MVMRIFYVFSPAPVHCNDNKSDTFSNQSTLDHNDSSNDNIRSSERGCFGSNECGEIPDPILLQQARCG